MTAVRDGSDDRPVDGRLARLARFVSSETFAVAFVWWTVLVALAPLCLVCAMGFHESGAFHVGVAFGLFGVALAGVATYRLVSILDRWHFTPA